MNLIQRCVNARNEFHKKYLRLPNVIALGKAEIKELEDYVYAENYIQPVLNDPNKVDTVYGMKLKRTDDETLLEVYLA